jgi:histidine triad (HIT) family protein
MEDCIFCKLVRKEVPANIVFEDENVVSFLELNQSAPGHVMVILKKHGASILDYNQEDLGHLMVGVQEVAKKVKMAMDADSLTIGINHLEKNGVSHLHVHIIPRRVDDKGGAIQSIVNVSAVETREQIAEKIKNAN